MLPGSKDDQLSLGGRVMVRNSLTEGAKRNYLVLKDK